MHFHDTPERRRLAIMRASDTKANSKGYSIGGLPHKVPTTRAAPSMPALPWINPPDCGKTTSTRGTVEVTHPRKRGKYDR